jgi:choline dehydrogenase-like flavoprotein
LKRAVVIGSGAGGASAAKTLQGEFAVTIVEAGGDFRPLGLGLKTADRLKRLGLLVDERLIGTIFPPLRVARMKDRVVLVWGRGTGGTTTISTGNALRMDRDLAALGFDLAPEFAEIEAEIPISTLHQRRWNPSTRALYDACSAMGLAPRPTPKMADPDKCSNCGRCILGCPSGAKWDARRFLGDAVARGAELVRDARAERIVAGSGRASGVIVRTRGKRRFVPADLVVIAAGGLGTPVILENSGIACRPTLFVDPVLCVAAEMPGARTDRDIPMPFVVQRDGFILSPYFDFLSYFFNRAWKPAPGNIVSLMIKLADEERGAVSARGIRKVLSPSDKRRLDEAAGLCRDILARAGIDRARTFLGTVNAGHPGGTLPLTATESRSFRNPALPDNVYIADATLLPHSLGNPPILTLLALARRVARAAAARCS